MMSSNNDTNGSGTSTSSEEFETTLDVDVDGGGGGRGLESGPAEPASTATDDGSTPPSAHQTRKSDRSDIGVGPKTNGNVARTGPGSNRSLPAEMFHQHPRILGRNLNGTIAMTTQPSNESELQLYRVLQRANLLAYYDTFICQGGDDVQQLYDAAEEEFLEIMALVGMAAKPLHVRRLQKALLEWATNPALFQSPLASGPVAGAPSSGPQPSTPSITFPSGGSGATENRAVPLLLNNNNATTGNDAPLQQQQQHHHHQHHLHHHHNHGHHHPGLTPVANSPFPASGTNLSATPSPSQFQNADYSQPCSPSGMTPILMESQIQRLAESAETLIRAHPFVNEWKHQPSAANGQNSCAGNRKRIVKEIEAIMNMSEDDPRRMEEIRKYAAIYGRFDCKRKPEKPLTLHEVSVNEAAAQICSKVPALLYRRDELFPLARQVVRESGYQYSKGHSRSQSCRLIDDHSDTSAERKRPRLEHQGSGSGGTASGGSTGGQGRNNSNDAKTPAAAAAAAAVSATTEEDRKRRHNRLEGIVDQLKSLGNKQEEIECQIREANERQSYQEASALQTELDLIASHHMQLINEKSQLERQQQLRGKSNGTGKKNGTGAKPADLGDISAMIGAGGDTVDSPFSLYCNDDDEEEDAEADEDDDDDDDDDDDEEEEEENEDNENSTPSSSLLLAQPDSNPGSSPPSLNLDGADPTPVTPANQDSPALASKTSTGAGNGKKLGSGAANNNGNNVNLSLQLATNSNSDDFSIDFSKQMHEVIDEGLRLMGQVMTSTPTPTSGTTTSTSASTAAIAAVSASDENIDLRLFKSYSESVLRTTNNPVAATTNNNGRSKLDQQHSNGAAAQRRGRPPKNIAGSGSAGGDLSGTFYEQLISQAQIQQQMHQMYQTQLQQSLYAQALFGEFTGLPAAAAAAAAAAAVAATTEPPSSNNDNGKEEITEKVNLQSDHHRQSEIVRSLNALISVAPSDIIASSDNQNSNESNSAGKINAAVGNSM